MLVNIAQIIIKFSSRTETKADDDKRCVADGIFDKSCVVIITLWVVTSSSILSIITQPPQPFQRRLCELAIRSRSVRAKQSICIVGEWTYDLQTQTSNFILSRTKMAETFTRRIYRSFL